jgi:membrane fusion protein, multidrug efflux system
MSTPSNDPADLTGAPVQKKNRTLSRLIFLLLLAALGVWGFRQVHLAMSSEVTDDAYIEGHVHRVTAGVAGPLLEVNAEDNQLVKKGQLLARIDPLEFEIAQQKANAAKQQARSLGDVARAQEAQGKASLNQADAQIAAAQASIRELTARRDLAEISFKRAETLSQGENRSISQAEHDTAKADYDAAKAALENEQAQLASAIAGRESTLHSIESSHALIGAAEAQLETAEAQLREAQRQISLTELRAPEEGLIGAKNAELGNRVQVGQSIYAVVEEKHWIVANFKETQLKKIKVGERVKIEVDSIPGRDFEGRVESLAPATGAEFALLPPDNSTGNFTKVVQRVPVKIVFDPEPSSDDLAHLKPGLSCVTRVVTN